MTLRRLCISKGCIKRQDKHNLSPRTPLSQLSFQLLTAAVFSDWNRHDGHVNQNCKVPPCGRVVARSKMSGSQKKLPPYHHSYCQFSKQEDFQECTCETFVVIRWPDRKRGTWNNNKRGWFNLFNRSVGKCRCTLYSTETVTWEQNWNYTLGRTWVTKWLIRINSPVNS